MLKLIGALLLAGGAGALGCSAAAQLSRRVAVLRALLGALEGMEREIAFRLTPMPELLERAAGEGWAACAVRKDGGDDPDVTDGALICARVERSTGPGIAIDGGQGGGRGTRRSSGPCR